MRFVMAMVSYPRFDSRFTMTEYTAQASAATRHSATPGAVTWAGPSWKLMSAMPVMAIANPATKRAPKPCSFSNANPSAAVNSGAVDTATDTNDASANCSAVFSAR